MKNLIALAVLVVLGVMAFLVFREPPVDPEKKKVTDAIKAIPVEKIDTITIKRLEGKDEDKKEGDHQSGGHKRQNDPPERVDAPGTHHAGRMLQRKRDLFNEAQHHPYDEGKCCGHIEHPQAHIGVKHIEPCAQ